MRLEGHGIQFQTGNQKNYFPNGGKGNHSAIFPKKNSWQFTDNKQKESVKSYDRQRPFTAVLEASET